MARQRGQFWEGKPEEGQRSGGQGYWTSGGSKPGVLARRHLQKASQRTSLMIRWYSLRRGCRPCRRLVRRISVGGRSIMRRRRCLLVKLWYCGIPEERERGLVRRALGDGSQRNVCVSCLASRSGMPNDRPPISTFCLSILCCIKHSGWVLVDQPRHANNMPERYLKRASNQGKQGQQRRYRERSASHLLSFCSLLEQRGGFAVSKLSSLLCGLL